MRPPQRRPPSTSQQGRFSRRSRVPRHGEVPSMRQHRRSRRSDSQATIGSSDGPARRDGVDGRSKSSPDTTPAPTGRPTARPRGGMATAPATTDGEHRRWPPTDAAMNGPTVGPMMSAEARRRPTTGRLRRMAATAGGAWRDVGHAAERARAQSRCRPGPSSRSPAGGHSTVERRARSAVHGRADDRADHSVPARAASHGQPST